MKNNSPLPAPTSPGAEILYNGIQVIESQLQSLSAQSQNARAAYALVNNGSSPTATQGDPEPQPTGTQSGIRKRKPMSQAARQRLSVKAKERYAAQRAESAQGGKAGRKANKVTRVMGAAG